MPIAEELLDTVVASHAARCESCDGSRDDREPYRADEAAVQEGFGSGRFVTDRPTPSQPMAQDWLGKAHWLAGEREGAIELVRRASSAWPGSAMFAEELAAPSGTD